MACSKQSPVNEVPATDYIDTTNGAAKYSGTFLSAPGESVNGTALVLLKNGAYSLALKNMMIGGGPDLHVYLSKQTQPLDFIDLGKLKSTGGDQVYEVKDNVDFTNYKYALIFCQQYNVLFGSAQLK
ncbi:MAG: DM13 domain-containing protein [Ferruginibacter sp.]